MYMLRELKLPYPNGYTACSLLLLSENVYFPFLFRRMSAFMFLREPRATGGQRAPITPIKSNGQVASPRGTLRYLPWPPVLHRKLTCETNAPSRRGNSVTAKWVVII